MEFKVNLLNEFLKIRQGYFTSINTIIDEICQNAQRAKADRLVIRFRQNSIEISDNGVGCESLEALLTKSQSGWSQEVMENQNPAGEGFYSTAMISNMVTFQSKISVQFDFGKLFESKTLDVIKMLDEKIHKGTTITLNNLLQPIVEIQNSWIAHITENLNYVPMDIEVYTIDDSDNLTLFDTFGNGIEALKQSIKNNDKNNLVVENDDFLYIFDVDQKSCKLFFQDRLVTTSRDFFGGYLFIKNGAIDVRLPDRKDVVYNNRYEEVRIIISKIVAVHISNIPYVEYTEIIKNHLDNMSGNNLYNVFKDVKIGYDCNAKKDMTIEDFSIFQNKTIFYVDRFEYNGGNETEIVENNLHNGNQIIDVISPFRYVIRSKFNIDFKQGMFSGFQKKFDKINDYTTIDFMKYTADFTDFLKGRGFRIDYYEIEVGNYVDADGYSVFGGLCGAGKVRIHSDHEVNLKGKKRCERFWLENLDTIIHEFTHHIYKSDDETTFHFKSMTLLHKEWNIYFNQL